MNPPSEDSMERQPANIPRCQGVRRDGSPCNASPTAKSGYRFCPWHQPDIPEDEKLSWASKGGLASRPSVLPEAADIRLHSPEGCMAILEETASQVRRGELSPNVANSIGYLVSVAVKVVEVTLSDRLDKLEKLALNRWR
jgi:hypothetical protein